MPTLIPNTPFRVPDLLLPNKSVDLQKWAVIACDQFTGSLSYWKDVEEQVGENPSTLHLTVPEIYFNEPDLQKRYNKIQEVSQQYISQNILQNRENTLLLLHRTSPRVPKRRGLVLQIDLSQYDPDPQKNVPIKSTEGIITSRLPKRIEMRKHSCLDLSHVLVMYEDKEFELITALEKTQSSLAYSTELMMNGGSIEANHLNLEKAIPTISGFFKDKIIAVGDGNHSLMSAKQIWLDSGADEQSPERWALVELVNIYDEGIQVEPIHRILTQTNTTILNNALQATGEIHDTIPTTNYACILQKDSTPLYWTPKDNFKLHVEVFENEILPQENLFVDIDFLHTEIDVKNIVNEQDNNIGILFSNFDRSILFETVRHNRIFPRKSFSLGQSEDKKYYIESCLRKLH